MSKVEIGSRYEGPCYDRPALRQMPRHWVLEEARRRPSTPWWQRIDRAVAIVVALLVLVACAQAAIRVLTAT